MIAYEVAVRGVGRYSFDLRRRCDGATVAGTERSYLLNAGAQPQTQIARFSFDPPIPLTTDSLYFGVRVDGSQGGLVVAGMAPIIGESGSDIFVVPPQRTCEPAKEEFARDTLHVSITCAGELPLGACCDPYLTECNDGIDAGKRCLSDADCTAPGGCEAVCRQTTKLNCPFPPRDQIMRPEWQLGEMCGPKAFPEACGLSACCHFGENPTTHLLEELCINLTRSECEAQLQEPTPPLWQLGQYCGLAAQRCPRNTCLDRSRLRCYPGEVIDPFCCESVCRSSALGEYCCNVTWDPFCCELVEGLCFFPRDNDQCAAGFPNAELDGALLIPVPGSAVTNNGRATNDENDPGLCCHNGVGTCISGPDEGSPCVVDQECDGGACSERTAQPGSSSYGSVWFKFVPPVGVSTAGIQTCTSNSPALDSILQVFEAQDESSPRAACESLAVIGCADDSPNCGSTGRNSRLCLKGLAPGKTYYVLVAAKTPNRRGEYRVSITTSCTGGDVHPNDYCRNATAVSNGVTPFDLSGASFDCPAAACIPNAQNDLWYEYTATCSGRARFATCGADSNDSPDTNLAVYEGCDRCPPLAGEPVGCDDNAYLGCGRGSRVSVDVTQGQCYRVRVADNDGWAVSGDLTITCEPTGACCDWVNTDENGEAVCRDVPLSECPALPNGDPPHWIEDASCTDQPFDPPCGIAACCHYRESPSTQLLEEVCEDLTKTQCQTAPPLDH